MVGKRRLELLHFTATVSKTVMSTNFITRPYLKINFFLTFYKYYNKFFKKSQEVFFFAITLVKIATPRKGIIANRRRGAESRTPIHGFGDRQATITPNPYMAWRRIY